MRMHSRSRRSTVYSTSARESAPRNRRRKRSQPSAFDDQHSFSYERCSDSYTDVVGKSTRDVGNRSDERREGLREGQGQSTTFKSPYMDVQTVKTNLTMDQAAKLEGQSHSLLLVEPVLLPSLGHTGITKETLSADHPLFYPNGYKKCGLGSTIRDTLYEQTAAGNGSKERNNEAPSDWAGSSAFFSLSGSSLERTNVLAKAVPAGQGGQSPNDVWASSSPKPSTKSGSSDTRTAHGAWTALSASTKSTESHATRRQPTDLQGDHRVGKTRSGAGRTKESKEQQNRSKFHPKDPHRSPNQHRRGWHDYSPSSTGSISSRGRSAGIDESGYLESGEDPAHPSHTVHPMSNSSHHNAQTASSGVSFDSSLGWTDSNAGHFGVDTAGRDSEWAAERRAADREAREVVGALKRNSTRLWFLVGGGV